MIYINKDDLVSIIQERLLFESIALALTSDINDDVIINDIELKTIDLVNSYIAGKYDHVKIFATAPEVPIRNGLLVQIIASIVTYRAVRRNAARKVPEDLVTLYTDSVKQLERIQSGAMTLVGCPVLLNADGTITPKLFGNNTNNDFYI